MKDEIHLSLTSTAKNVAVARIAVATFAANAGFTIPDVEEIKVAVSEAVSNAVLHAYPEGKGQVSVRAIFEKDELIIEVSDQGCGIPDLTKAREPGFTTTPEHMGLGLSFVESFMDSVSLTSETGVGTRVRMVKRRCR